MSHHYKVRKGDTLSSLAARNGTTVSALAQANGIRNVNLILTGQSLKVSPSDKFRTQGGGGAAFGLASPTAMGISSVGGSSSNGQRLAQVANGVASRMNTRGWCARGVFDSLQAAGLGIPRSGSAYMAADTLARDPRFREVRLTDEQIRQLPPGAIVVSGPFNSPRNPHGHIAVTLGGGREASDHVQNLYLAGTQRVFLPV